MNDLAATRAIQTWIIEQRRTLHRMPELAYEEHRTSAHIQGVLGDLGIEFTFGQAGGTAVVGLLGKQLPGPCVALRADMDALPIAEAQCAASAAFTSETEGLMHACGHDSHMAMLLGAARILKQREAQLPGPVKLIFQPAEEGGAGAKLLCEEGVLEDPKVERIFGLHVWPQLATGEIGLRDGAFLASASFFEMRVTGKGGHAAMPHLSIDPIVAASQIVLALQCIVSRERDPGGANVVSVTEFHSGDACNVIPSEAILRGTLRSLSLEEQQANADRIVEIARSIGAAHRCQVEVDFPGTVYPPTVNDPGALSIARSVAASIAKHDSTGIGLVEVPQTMGGEDFSFYAQRVPACFAALGIGNPHKQTEVSLHNPHFQIDEDALAIGAAMHVGFACAVAPGSST